MIKGVLSPFEPLRVCTILDPFVLLACASDLRLCEKDLGVYCTYPVCAPYIPSKDVRRSEMSEKPQFREAERADVPLILQFIRELADYEGMLDEVVADEPTLEEWIFDRGRAEVVFALEDGREVGFALFFHNFSTFLGRAGLYLEDLYVRPEHRGKGYGKALLRRLAQIAVERGCGRLEWWCLDWNRPSIDFYLAMGAEPMSDWTVYRAAGDALAALAQPARQSN